VETSVCYLGALAFALLSHLTNPYNFFSTFSQHCDIKLLPISIYISIRRLSDLRILLSIEKLEGRHTEPTMMVTKAGTYIRLISQAKDSHFVMEDLEIGVYLHHGRCI